MSLRRLGLVRSRLLKPEREATRASPILGTLPAAYLDLALVRKVLDPIWTTQNETASRVRQRLESVLASTLSRIGI